MGRMEVPHINCPPSSQFSCPVPPRSRFVASRRMSLVYLSRTPTVGLCVYSCQKGMNVYLSHIPQYHGRGARWCITAQSKSTPGSRFATPIDTPLERRGALLGGSSLPRLLLPPRGWHPHSPTSRSHTGQTPPGLMGVFDICVATTGGKPSIDSAGETFPGPAALVLGSHILCVYIYGGIVLLLHVSSR